jgi:hypothetical protein
VIFDRLRNGLRLSFLLLLFSSFRIAVSASTVLLSRSTAERGGRAWS